MVSTVEQRTNKQTNQKTDKLDLWQERIMTPEPPQFPHTDGGILSPRLLSNSQKRCMLAVCNKSQCGWQGSCKFKHECSICGGLHLITRCSKQMAREESKQGSS